MLATCSRCLCDDAAALRTALRTERITYLWTPTCRRTGGQFYGSATTRQLALLPSGQPETIRERCAVRWDQSRRDHFSSSGVLRPSGSVWLDCDSTELCRVGPHGNLSARLSADEAPRLVGERHLVSTSRTTIGLRFQCGGRVRAHAQQSAIRRRAEAHQSGADLSGRTILPSVRMQIRHPDVARELAHRENQFVAHRADADIPGIGYVRQR